MAYNSKRHGPIPPKPPELVDPPPPITSPMEFTGPELATLWLACALLHRQLLYPIPDISQDLQEQILDTCEATWKRIVNVLNNHPR